MNPEHIFQVSMAIGAFMVSAIGFFAIRTLKTIDSNQEKLAERLDKGLGEAFERLRAVEIDLTEVRAEHRLSQSSNYNRTAS